MIGLKNGEPEERRPAVSNQTDTGLRSFEPAAWQNVVVSRVVWPFLVAVSSIGRQVPPSDRVVLGPAGLADTTVGWAAGVCADAVVAGFACGSTV